MGQPCEELEEEKKHFKQTITKTLMESLKRGFEENRVVCGILPCADLMKSFPEGVMFCLLWHPEDAATNILRMLIYGLCHEYGIKLLQIDGEFKMAQLFSMCQQPVKCRSDVLGLAPPKVEYVGETVGCIMVKFPKHNTSREDDMLIDYIQDQMKNNTDPTVNLADLTAAEMKEQHGIKLKEKNWKSQMQASPEVAALLSGM